MIESPREPAAARWHLGVCARLSGRLRHGAHDGGVERLVLVPATFLLFERGLPDASALRDHARFLPDGFRSDEISTFGQMRVRRVPERAFVHSSDP